MWSNDVGFIKIPTAESTNPFWFLMFIPKAKELLVPPAGASVSLRLPAGADQCLTIKLRSTSDEPAGSHTRCPEDFLLGFALQSLQLLRIQQLLRRKKAKNTQVLAPGLEFKSVTGWCPGPGPQGPGCLLKVNSYLSLSTHGSYVGHTFLVGFIRKEPHPPNKPLSAITASIGEIFALAISSL